MAHWALGGGNQVGDPRRQNMKAMKDRRGASAVEFALVLPLLIVLLFGIVEFGLLMYNKAVITNASREGARAGIVFSPRPDETSIKKVASDYADPRVVSFGAKRVTDPSVPSGKCTAFGNDLIVNVSYPYQFLVFSNVVSLLGSGTMSNTVTLTARTVMKCE
jgi:Flp pilus assembly protein TadG